MFDRLLLTEYLAGRSEVSSAGLVSGCLRVDVSRPNDDHCRNASQSKSNCCDP